MKTSGMETSGLVYPAIGSTSPARQGVTEHRETMEDTYLALTFVFDSFEPVLTRGSVQPGQVRDNRRSVNTGEISFLEE